MNSDELSRLPLHPPLITQPGGASGSGDAMTGVQLFPQQPTLPADYPSTSFGGAAGAQQVLQLFEAGQNGQHIYPPSATPYVGGFSQQQGQHPFPNPGTQVPGGEPNPSWPGDTLNMWSTAPTGFECVVADQK